MDKILIVDDDIINRLILIEGLKDTYIPLEAENGVQALEILNKNRNIRAVLLDICMPVMDGFNVLEKMGDLVSQIPVILITVSSDESSELKGLEKGAADFVGKPFNMQVVKARLSTHIRLKKHENSLNELIAESMAKFERMQNSILTSLANVVEYRSPDASTHIMRTQKLTILFVNIIRKKDKYRQYDDMYWSSVIKASVLHDIGKIGIEDQILLKPGKLTEEEYERIKRHSAIGEQITENLLKEYDSEFVKCCQEVCRFHHEKWNGEGYPDGLKGEEIPLSARIITIIDVYDALVSERIYKQAFSQDEAYKIIQSESGRHFDPSLVDILLDLRDEIQQMYKF